MKIRGGTNFTLGDEYKSQAGGLGDEVNTVFNMIIRKDTLKFLGFYIKLLKTHCINYEHLDINVIMFQFDEIPFGCALFGRPRVETGTGTGANEYCS